MGRQERRAYNKKHGTKLTKEQYDAMIAVARIQAGNFNLTDLSVPQDFAHADNYELAPDGCECKLNYSEIMSRSHNGMAQEYFDWVEEHKDSILHVTREGAINSLIGFEEDVRYKTDPDTGEQTLAPKWWFDTYTDILIKDTNGNWRTVLDIDTENSKKEDDKKE